MAKNACRCKKVECEECPEWIFTFADLVMLMMGFFVILWVTKPAGGGGAGDSDKEKEWIKTVASIRDAFGYIPDPASKDPVDIQLLQQRLDGPNAPRGPGDGGKVAKNTQGAEGPDNEVKTIRDGKQTIVGTSIVFAAGSADLSKESLLTVTRISDEIRGHRQITIIKGHTALDDLGDNATAAQKMDLSLRRAQAVADEMMTQGVDPEVLRVQGCSTFEPVVMRQYRPGVQAINRRVEVQVAAQLAEERRDQPLRPSEGAPPPAASPGRR